MSDMTFEGKYIAALGRRKTAVAQVRLYPKGQGRIVINGKMLEDYLPVTILQDRVKAPLVKVGMTDVDVTVRTLGGGIRGQADAICLGIARALVKMDETLRTSLKPEGFLTRDSRKVERKKPGLKKARRAPQWSKR